MATNQKVLLDVYRQIKTICEANDVSLSGNDCGEVTLNKRSGKQLFVLEIYIDEKA